MNASVAAIRTAAKDEARTSFRPGPLRSARLQSAERLGLERQSVVSGADGTAKCGVARRLATKVTLLCASLHLLQGRQKLVDLDVVRILAQHVTRDRQWVRLECAVHHHAPGQ